MSEKRIVVAVFVVDDSEDSEPMYYENVAVDVDNATNMLPSINQWVSEKVVSTKMKAIGL